MTGVGDHLNLVLIGYRGCGKTSVGRVVAEILGRGFVDTDCLVEEATGRTIAQIFADDGEIAFRKLESAAVRETMRASGRVVSLGGGAVLNDGDMDIVKSVSRVVWLTSSVATLQQRLGADVRTVESRPALTGMDAVTEIESVLSVRVPIYRRWADVEIATDDVSIDDVAGKVVDWLGETS